VDIEAVACVHNLQYSSVQFILHASASIGLYAPNVSELVCHVFFITSMVCQRVVLSASWFVSEMSGGAPLYDNAQIELCTV